MSLLYIWFVAVAFQSEEEVRWRREPLWPIFAPPWIRPRMDLAEKQKFVRDHKHFINTKFRKHPLSGSVVKADYVFPYMYMH